MSRLFLRRARAWCRRAWIISIYASSFQWKSTTDSTFPPYDETPKVRITCFECRFAMIKGLPSSGSWTVGLVKLRLPHLMKIFCAMPEEPIPDLCPRYWYWDAFISRRLLQLSELNSSKAFSVLEYSSIWSLLFLSFTSTSMVFLFSSSNLP